MLDTGVLLRALHDVEDDRSPACRAFWDAMLAERRQMIASAPAIAELIRKYPVPLPRVTGFSVVAFDERCAHALGQHLPMSVLKEARTRAGESMGYLKFDALILASALRYNVEVLVCLDADHHKLAAGLPLRCARPEDFEAKRRQLKLVEMSDDDEESA